MSAFKDAVANDIKAVFINGLEFADEHTINGQTVTCVVDRDEIKERGTPSASEYAEGVFIEQVMIFVAKNDLPRVPVKGELLRLDGERYLVDEVAENMGMLEITIQDNQS
ncbi:ATP-binding sugar transporter family protein [Vibrio phage phi 2]|uniref:minor tail protein n=1 Tax=Vibrio phage X29 TaxID=1500713 RepID=UPI00045FCCB5|nr:minor tail protein [Vibrio phage X29]AHN84823.1 ATP-binding sugar transporter family protein [Vibrio phage phi 2]AIA10336.1 hypothetical protein SBVcX29_0057 [Vibrio phage X29]